jgi:hypothetical protein
LQAALSFQQSYFFREPQVDLLEIGFADKSILFGHLLPNYLEALFGGNFLTHLSESNVGV